MGIYAATAIEATCGPKLAQYVVNKSWGGGSGQKGTRYEDHLAIFKVADAARIAFEKGKRNYSRAWDATFYSQMLCFVDDLVVCRSRRRSVDHYQAKNRKSTT